MVLFIEVGKTEGGVDLGVGYQSSILPKAKFEMLIKFSHGDVL